LRALAHDHDAAGTNQAAIGQITNVYAGQVLKSSLSHWMMERSSMAAFSTGYESCGEHSPWLRWRGKPESGGSAGLKQSSTTPLGAG
jgi:hypothetical protein